MRTDLPFPSSMKWIAAVCGLMSFAALPLTPAAAATPEEFLAACLAVAGEEGTELCNCKAEQAEKLVDAEMLDYIIMRLQDPQGFSEKVKAGDVPEDVVAKWPYYVRDSNAVCLAPPEEEADE